MDRNEFIKKITEIEINKETLESLEDAYGQPIPLTIIKILSEYTAPVLFDENESRTLSLIEVLNAEEIFGVPFFSSKLIPIVDLGCDDFIVYSSKNSMWCLYNIVDEIIFKETTDFNTLFLE